MKIALSQPLEANALRNQLGSMLPQYTYFMRGGSIIVVQKTAAVGATVLVRKNKLVVNGNFPSMGMQMVFVLSIVFLGFLLPLIVYFLTLYKSQKAVEKEVGAALEAMLRGAPAQPMQGGYAQASM